MTTEPSQEYAKRQLQLADEALSDAKYLLEDNRLKAAANRAYYAMFYAASAALTSTNVKLPKRHRAVITLFYRHFVEAGKMPREFHRDFVRTFQRRLQSDYEIYAHIGEEEVRETVGKAEAFVAEVKKVMGIG